MKEVVLSKRLQALADMVTPGRCVVDVGCDHGFVSIYLIQKKISPRVLAMDVREGPLSRAREHIKEYGLERYIETRLSDGLREYQEGEVQGLICAGMGGRLMTRILTESRKKARELSELILQPQSELSVFRSFLRREGYILIDENIVFEEGKYYFLMKVAYQGEAVAQKQIKQAKEDVYTKLYDSYGELLIKRKNPLLKRYLEENLQSLKKLESVLLQNDKERARKRLCEIQEEIGNLQQALALMV
ncbi:MAG: SAM-dependent methyltransferase [Lachnospiraceae bacterium]|nr:SAM-dependent methyltransferase [Lachnospiraceae bacterium]